MIVVIGAGLIGLGIAFELARRGAEVRVLDAREPGGGASWAGAGMLAPFTETLASDAFAAMCAEALARFPRFVDDVRAAGGVDARLHLDGIVETAYDAGEAARLQVRVDALRARGVPARWLTRDEVRRMEPALGPGVLGAAWSESEGHVDNRRLGRALRAACEALGVTVDAHAGPVALEADARRVLGVRGPAGFVPATAVVNASGAWAGALEGVPARARVPVVPVKGQMLALAVPRGFVRRVLWVPGSATVAHPYLVPRDDGRLLIGATVEDGAGFDVRVTARGTQGLLDAALTALPALGEFAIAESWAGLRPGTPDGLPYLGETEVAGYFVASGHYRNGILLTPATAVALADAVERRPGAALADGGALASLSPRRAASAPAVARGASA
jgi:glycine oxidase